tara:strand:- start:9257 stop:10957 length:1701 start_codon:yes stop_codon:yes gene_type:complete
MRTYFQRIIVLSICFGAFDSLPPAASQDELVKAPATASAARFLDWGDQGDGTYANPVLNGDFADSDVEKFGDTWYLITSTNHYAPGMTIMQSRDLVNWKYTAHAIPSLSWQPNYHWDQMNGYRFGCWAGDLVYRDGEWLCYQIDFQSGLYMTKAKQITGPWSEPVCLLERKHWTDPAVYFDEAKKEAWLVCNWGKGSPPRRDQPHEIKLFKLSWDGTRLLDEGTTIFSGTAVEAAKIRRFNDQWYIMMIEWQGEGKQRDRKQLCLRSTTDSIYGPYESRVVMERASDDHRSACQGSLIESPDGRWWFMHQLVQNGEPVFHGRPQCLQPVQWKDGWPIIGVDSDGDGIGEPIWSHEKPMPSDAADQLQMSDEFDSDVLGLQWNWNHNPRTERFSFTQRPGFLRLIASKPSKVDRDKLKGAFWGAPNTLSQRQLGVGKTQAETKLDLSGMKIGTVAGLTHHSGKYALFGVRMDPSGEKRLFFNDNGKQQPITAIKTDTLYLRSNTDGDQATFSWSNDGEQWNQIEPTYQLNFGNWRGNRPGIFCWNGRTDDINESGYVDFDWFHYTYE